MCYIQDGYGYALRTRYPRAKKQHHCDDCSDAIEPGEVYELYAGMWEGDFCTIKTCRRCKYDRLRVYIHERSEGCSHNESFPNCGELQEALVCDLGWDQTPKGEVPETFNIKEPFYEVWEAMKS